MGDRAAKIDDILRRVARGHCSPARVADAGCALCEPRLEALRELRAMLAEEGRSRVEGVAVFENGVAPPGWVEVQREDAADAFADDDAAAAAVCVAAGVPPECGARIIVFDIAAGDWLASPLGVPPDRTELDETDAEPACVPAIVAHLAGLISLDELRVASVDWT